MGRRKTKKRNIKKRIWSLKKSVKQTIPAIGMTIRNIALLAVIIAIFVFGAWFMYTNLWGKSIGDNINCICTAGGVLIFILISVSPIPKWLEIDNFAGIISIAAIILIICCFIPYLKVIPCIIFPIIIACGIMTLIWWLAIRNYEGDGEPGEGAALAGGLFVLYFLCFIGGGIWGIHLISHYSEYF